MVKKIEKLASDHEATRSEGAPRVYWGSRRLLLAIGIVELLAFGSTEHHSNELNHQT